MANHFVRIGNHITEVSLWIIFVTLVGCRTKSLWIPVTGVWRWIKRAVGENHWEIDKEGVLFILLDKVTNEIGAYLGTVFTIRVVLLLAVELKHWIDEAAIDSFPVFIGATRACVLPQTGFFKSEMLG